MSISVQDVETQLHAYGANKICDFHQRGRGSFCRGMCLDWIRRILNGKGVTYGYAMNTVKGQRAFDRQVQTHNAFVEVAKDKSAVLGTGIKLENTLAWKKTFGSLMFWTPSETQLESQLAPSRNLSTQINNQGVVEPYWPDFSARWKTRVRSSSTGGDKARAMDSFHVQGNPFFQPSQSKSTADYLKDGIALLQKDDCALIDVHFNEGSGHAWAWHCNNGTYEFFDPNYGIFDVKRPEDLLDCMRYLLDTVYPSFGLTVKSIEFVQMWR
jgi:hypothetical protein